MGDPLQSNGQRETDYIETRTTLPVYVRTNMMDGGSRLECQAHFPSSITIVSLDWSEYNVG